MAAYNTFTSVSLCKAERENTCCKCGDTIMEDAECYAVYKCDTIGDAFIEAEMTQCCECTEGGHFATDMVM